MIWASFYAALRIPANVFDTTNRLKLSTTAESLITRSKCALVTVQSNARPRKYGQIIMASRISHQTRPAKPIVNSQPMNQIGPMRVGERRRYQRLFSFSSAMFFSFYKIVYLDSMVFSPIY